MRESEAIVEDFTAFADHGTPIDLSGGTITWTAFRQKRTAAIRAEGSELIVRYNERDYEYRAFFASEHMGDLRGIAEAQLTFNADELYIEPEVLVEGNDAIQASKWVQTLNPTSTTSTQLLFLHADAGLGKTTLLRRLTHQQAQRHLAGETQWIFFYVDAQGKALSRLNDAIAAVLDDLRVRIGYREMATLTRLGLVVPIVDGFDELLGVGGYDDAFRSLAELLHRLAGEGMTFVALLQV
jgi:hypothetical protein